MDRRPPTTRHARTSHARTSRRRRIGPTLAPATLSRLRWWLRRRPAVAWLAGASLALAAAMLVGSATAEAQRQSAAWGPGPLVAVATRPLAPGETVGPGDVSWRQWPQALLPDGAVVDPVGRVVATQVLRGEPVAAARLADGDGQGPNALAPQGHRVLGVPTDLRPPPLRPGDLVDLYSAVTATGGLPAPGDEATRVAQGAVVVAVDEEVVSVAVAPPDVPGTSAALLAGPVVVAQGGLPQQR